MDQYEDLQKFQEKTHMKSIRFIDFTKQNKEVNHGQWSIVHQLAKGDIPMQGSASPTLTSPIHHEALAVEAVNPVNVASTTTGYQAATQAHSLFNDVGAQLNRSAVLPQEAPPEPEQQPEVQALSPLPSPPSMQAKFQPQPRVQAQPTIQPQSSIQAQLQFQSQPAVQAQPQYQPQPAVQTQPQYQPQPAVQEQSQTHFSHLFSAPADELSAVGKDAPLQSLLKRIATCR